MRAFHFNFELLTLEQSDFRKKTNFDFFGFFGNRRNEKSDIGGVVSEVNEKRLIRNGSRLGTDPLNFGHREIWRHFLKVLKASKILRHFQC